ncbi:carboxymuconolactone decarboxylase family protein [Salinirubellus salinus]|uniref:Carboxymuconolactone decarboxylase family protein n=1 Tax=Salinirubellus salinus TaxID=1364945 RepID=A0A9E7R1E7_9EURY|nr:carboxymuconolactone decarboxylase family protein [Salinirubellus salinus]UWM53743.1 carboxymuconolactone decarboxylase family protein [Salinirubellus salinus]
MARVPYLESEDLPDEYASLLEDNSLGPLHIFRAFANDPPVLQSYMRWGSTLWREAGLDRRAVELVVLTVASELDAVYEWHQHVPLGLEFGLTETEILTVRAGEFDAFDADDEALACYARAVVTGEVDDATYAAFAEREWVDDRTVVGVTLLAGQYLMTARALEALAVEPEGEFVGWDLEGL